MKTLGLCAGVAVLGLGLGWMAPAYAACTVDSVETHVKRHERVDVVRLYVDTGAVDCTRMRLSHPGEGQVVSAKARVLRGDVPNERFPDVLDWTAAGGELVAWAELPGLRPRDIVELTVERRVGDDWRWSPGQWGGAPGWATLKADATPTSATVPREKDGWGVDRPVWEAAGGNLSVTFGSPPETAPGWSLSEPASLVVQIEVDGPPPPHEPPRGTTRRTWTIPVGPSGAHAVVWPPDSVDRVCRVEGRADAQVFPTDAGCAVRHSAGATLVAAWTVSGVRIAEDWGPADRGAAPQEGRALGPVGTGWRGAPGLGPVGPWTITIDAPGLGLQGEVRTGDVRDRAISGNGHLELSLPSWEGGGSDSVAPLAAFRVTSVHGQPVLSDRDALLDAVARAAVRASIPEPGLPARIRVQKADETVLPEVLALLRDQVRIGKTADQRSLQPRPLLDVRKSSYATEWELALVTARYLRQLRLEAIPVPVRLPTGGPSDAAMPAGFDHAVVWLQLPGVEALWLDPACPVCAVGELRPTLWGAEALSERWDRLPDAPPAALVETVSVSATGEERVETTVSGAAAVALRLFLLDFPTDGRKDALAQLLGGEVVSLADLGALGQPATVTVTRTGTFDPQRPEARWVIPDGAVLRLPWTGTLVREVRFAPEVPAVWVPPAADATVDGAGLAWSRVVGVDGAGVRFSREELQRTAPVVHRDDFLALRDRMKAGPAQVLDPPAGTGLVGDKVPAELVDP